MSMFCYGLSTELLTLLSAAHNPDNGFIWKDERKSSGKRQCPLFAEPLFAWRVPADINKCWSADFMSDARWRGRKFRTFNLLDDFNREALGIEINLNLPAQRIVRVLDRVAAWRGYPEKLRVDNGLELTSVKLAQWAEEHSVSLEFIQPGKPTQNSFVERFNRTYRNEVLSAYAFNRLSEVRRIRETG